MLLWDEIRILGEPAEISKFLCPRTSNWTRDIWAVETRELFIKKKISNTPKDRSRLVTLEKSEVHTFF